MIKPEINFFRILAACIWFSLTPCIQYQILSGQVSPSPFTIKEDYNNAYNHQQLVKRAMHYDFDHKAFENSAEKSNNLRFSIPTFSGNKELNLKRVNLLSEDYFLSTSEGLEFRSPGEYLFYHGYVEGDDKSKVALTFNKNTIKLLILDGDGNYEVNQVEGNLYAGYYSADQKITKEWECATEDIPHIRQQESRGQNPYRSGDCVEIYLEIDYAMYVKKGSSIGNTESWALSLMNEVSILYIEWDIPLTVSQIHVYTSTDPFASTGNTSATLPIFRDSINNKTWNGRLAHLLSGRSMGGGIAYLNQLCGNYNNVAISANLSGGTTSYPNYSWNVMVVAHELGHNFGSPHTHDCSWNGNYTSIDGCGFIKGYGGCDGPIPPKGTIMSYCHLVSGVGISLSEGFGPQPGALIQSRYQNASCTTGTNCQDVPPFNDVCTRAQDLNVLLSCNPSTAKLINAASSGVGNLSCGNGGNEYDVWYKLEYPMVNSITIETKQITNGLSDLILEVYKGSCGNLISYACDDNNGDGNHSKIVIMDSSLQGQELYIRVVESGSDEEGIFGICAHSTELPCTDIVDTLINIYDDAGGNSWINNTGWVDGKAGLDCDYCQWYGITCDGSGNITHLNLRNNNLTGTLSSSIDGLVFLENLDLSINQLSGIVPDVWSMNDELLILNLSNNQLTGAIPPSFEEMNLINTIYIDNNNFSTSLPITLGYKSSLRNFSASHNQFSGCFPQSFTSFCYKDSFNLNNNPDLPFAGDVTNLCLDGSGKDYDQDNYCYNIDDCDDYNDTVNSGATEECDGIDNNCDGNVDEGHNNGPNVWSGAATGGNWMDHGNWSMGHTPLGCEEIDIGFTGPSVDISIPDQYSSNFKSISVGSGSELTFGDGGNIILIGGGNITNHGVINFNGYIQIGNLYGTGKDGILNSGTLNMVSGTYLNISDAAANGIFNQASGIINNDGSFNINSDSNSPVINGIKNQGIINNSGYIYISGIFSGTHLLLEPTSVLNSTGQRHNIYLSTYSEGQGSKENSPESKKF